MRCKRCGCTDGVPRHWFAIEVCSACARWYERPIQRARFGVYLWFSRMKVEARRLFTEMMVDIEAWPRCKLDFDAHEWEGDYYGLRCKNCGEWVRDDFFDEEDPYDEYDGDIEDEFERAMERCSMFPDEGVWMCGAAGSEDCDWECPFSDRIGTPVQRSPLDAEIPPGGGAGRKGRLRVPLSRLRRRGGAGRSCRPPRYDRLPGGLRGDVHPVEPRGHVEAADRGVPG